jgi:hypothetical protein
MAFHRQEEWTSRQVNVLVTAVHIHIEKIGTVQGKVTIARALK